LTRYAVTIAGRTFVREGTRAVVAEGMPAVAVDSTKAIATPRDAAERRLMAALEELFATLAPDVAARLAKGEMPSEQELADALAKVIQPELVKAAVEEFERLGVSVGVQFDPAVVNEAMVAWAQSYTFDLVKGLTATTRTTLQRAMEQFTSTPGMTRGQLEALLEPVFGKVRAEAISITEVTRAATAAIEQYQAELDGAGIQMEKIWHTNRDELVCPLCGPLDGKPESKWGDSGPPPRHTRCRCFTTLRLAGEKP
jgi:hypothetical protein